MSRYLLEAGLGDLAREGSGEAKGDYQAWQTDGLSSGDVGYWVVAVGVLGSSYGTQLGEESRTALVGWGPTGKRLRDAWVS